MKLCHIEKIEYGSEKVGFWSHVAFALIILLTLVAIGIRYDLLEDLIHDAQVASTRQFIEDVECYLHTSV